MRAALQRLVRERDGERLRCAAGHQRLHKSYSTTKNAHHHACTSRADRLGLPYAFHQGGHGDVVALVHAPRLSKQDPRLVPAFSIVAFLDRRL